MSFLKRVSGVSVSGLFFLFSISLVSSAFAATASGHGGELSGTIKIKGAVPANAVEKINRNPEVCGSSAEQETYLVNSSNQGVQNVLVYIEGIADAKNRSSSTLILENNKCRFHPHVLAGMLGDFVEIKNSDPLLHNTHLKLEGNTFLNVVLPPNGKDIKKEFVQGGTVSVKCDAHPFMHATIYIRDNPWFALTDNYGNFRISDVPPGKYKVKIVGEGYLETEKEVTIGGGEKKIFMAEISPN